MSKKPIIAVTGPDKGGFMAWFFTMIAVRRAGGKPIRIRPEKFDEIPAFDGLILGGGADISPEFYDGKSLDEIKDISEKEKKRNPFRWIYWLLFGIFIIIFRKIFSLDFESPVDPARDDMEKKMLENSLKHKKPVLGICRGAQFMNIHSGGNLYQDISGFYGETPKVDTIYPRKEINIEPGTKLAEILGAETVRVNSLHNQAVQNTGKNIRISARENTGVAQAVEYENAEYPFFIGIQWHPEYLPQIKQQQQLFRSLVKSTNLESF